MTGMRRAAAALFCLLLMPLAGQAADPRAVEGVTLRNDAWPRATNLAEWTADVMRISGVENSTETAQGKAFFEWLRLFSRMAVGGMIQSYEGPRDREVYVVDAHKQLFVYGWGYCDTTSRIAEAAWQEYKQDWRAAERVITQHEDGGYHTMYRLRMDGRHGAFDPRYGYYLIERDEAGARILDWNELHGRFEINRGYQHRSRPFFEILGKEWERALLIQPGYYESEEAWRKAGAPIEHVFGDGAYRMGTRFHDMSFTLMPGMTVTQYWDNSARKFYVPSGQHTKRDWPFLPSGRFYRVTEQSHGGNWPKYDPNHLRARPQLATVPLDEGYPPDLAGGRTIGQACGVIEYSPVVRMQDGEAVVEVRSPFVLVDGTLRSPAGVAVEMRTLAPKPRHALEADNWSEWRTLAGEPLDIHGKYRFQLRVKGSVTTKLRMRLYFENGIMSIPPLFSGRNALRLRVAGARDLSAPVTVVYRYETAAGEKSHQQVLRRGDFRNNEAAYEVNAPGLVRCRSVSISH